MLFEVVMQRNFGQMQRCPMRAASKLLNSSCDKGGLSYASVSSLLNRFEKFVEFAKAHGVNRLDRVSREVVVEYAKHLIDSDYSSSYKQNLLSAVNTVMREGYSVYGLHWKSVKASEEKLPKRTNIRTEPTSSKEQLSVAQQSMSAHASVIAELARELGLRTKEAALLNAKTAYEEATDKHTVTIVEGTKGGRKRTVIIREASQVAALYKASLLQGNSHSLVPQEMTWKSFRNSVLYQGREALKKSGIKDYHSLRASFAADLYEELTGSSAPCNSGGKRIVERSLDAAARLEVSEQLGHGRVDVTVAYLGGRR